MLSWSGARGTVETLSAGLAAKCEVSLVHTLWGAATLEFLAVARRERLPSPLFVFARAGPNGGQLLRLASSNLFQSSLLNLSAVQ